MDHQSSKVLQPKFLQYSNRHVWLLKESSHMVRILPCYEIPPVYKCVVASPILGHHIYHKAAHIITLHNEFLQRHIRVGHSPPKYEFAIFYL